MVCLFFYTQLKKGKSLLNLMHCTLPANHNVFKLKFSTYGFLWRQIPFHTLLLAMTQRPRTESMAFMHRLRDFNAFSDENQRNSHTLDAQIHVSCSLNWHYHVRI